MIVSVVILFPDNDSGYKFAKIYRSDIEASIDPETGTETYVLIDTVLASQYEYEDAGGDYSKFYKVAFSDGTTTTEQISVQSNIQKIIQIIRKELTLSETALSGADIDYLFSQAKTDVMNDICTYNYGAQITKLEEGIYSLPNRYFFDYNFGGKVTPLDITFFRQVVPVYVYSEKIPVQAAYIDPEDKFVELTAPLNSTDVLKACYFSVGRRLSAETQLKLVAYRICSVYYDNIYTQKTSENSASNISKVKIGDISIETGSSSSSSSVSASAAKDNSLKMQARYNKLIMNYKTGFVRVH